MRRYPEAAAFVLAGGGSSRMGRDKGLLELGGVPLVVRTVRLVQPLVGCVRVIAPAGRYPGLELDVLPDRDFADVERDGSRPGPLAGIATALESSPAEWNIILACDLPYLTTEWLDWLLARATVSRAQAVVPRTGRGVEPLAAAYRRGCAAPISAAFVRGVRAVTEALAFIDVEEVREPEWQSVDPGGRVLNNMNTSEDYEEAKRWWEGQARPGRELT